MMVKVLIYAYATGVFSSRAIARKLEEDVAFRVLGRELSTAPHDLRVSPSPSRRLRAAVCRGRAGGARDGGGALWHAVGGRDEGACEREQAQGDELRADVDRRGSAEGGDPRVVGPSGAVDEQEDARYGEQVRGDELPAELHEGEASGGDPEAKERLEAEQRAADDARGRKPGQRRNPKGGRPYKRDYGEPEPKTQSNFTDPESQIMNTSSEGFQQCYNAQTVVDETQQIIVATDVEANASDQGQMLPMLDEVSATFEVEPEVVLPTRGTATRRTSWRWISMLISRWAARARRRWRWTPISVRPPTAWARSSPAPRARLNTPSAVVVRGAERLDQRGAGIPPVQRTGRAQGPRRMAPRLLGIEHQAHGGAGGMLTQPMALRGVDSAGSNAPARGPYAFERSPRRSSAPDHGKPESRRSVNRPTPYGQTPFARRENFCGAHS